MREGSTTNVVDSHLLKSAVDPEAVSASLIAAIGRGELPQPKTLLGGSPLTGRPGRRRGHCAPGLLAKANAHAELPRARAEIEDYVQDLLGLVIVAAFMGLPLSSTIREGPSNYGPLSPSPHLAPTLGRACIDLALPLLLVLSSGRLSRESRGRGLGLRRE
jgi:hypothetical protein